MDYKTYKAQLEKKILQNDLAIEVCKKDLHLIADEEILDLLESLWRKKELLEKELSDLELQDV